MKKLFLTCSPKSTASRLWHSSTMPHHHSSNPSCITPNYTRHLLQSQSECLAQHRGLAAGTTHPNERSSSAINLLGKLGRLWYGPSSSCNTMSMTGNQTVSRRYGHRASDDFSLTREWFVKRWLGDKKHEQKQKKRPVRSVPATTSGYSYTSVTEEPMTTPQEMPPITQSGTGALKPASPEELKVAPLLARSNLLVTRNIEWANIMLGFEQENRYAMVDPHFPESPAGFILEQSNLIARQILRTRRPFIAKITDSLGNELFRVRRPIWWITSSIYVEVDGKEIGVVHRRWHLWKRIYDLYLGNQQFAVVENPGFWYWTFTLKDIDGNVLAEIDRDWRGFGFELLTDAGQYVIRFGDVNPGSKSGPAKMIKDLEVDRPLRLSERAVALALAVSLDNDYFSRHGGWGLPFIAVAE